jgi:O-acetyl-ADP-ribose deacetylase (regulator of RNase III)
MSNLIHAQGNLLDMAEAGNFDVIIQGCNCFNAMGGGIAREIAMRYPHVAEVDMKTVRGDYNKLGTYTREVVSGHEHSFIVINAYTQFETSRSEDVFEYVAFDLILQKMVRLWGIYNIGLPYIGMGLAGGDKTRIIPMIEKFAEHVYEKGGSVTLVEFK